MFSRHIIRDLGLTVSLAALGAAPVSAAPRFDPMFGDHAVIQRDHPVTVTGRSDPGEAVSVTLAGEVRQVRADREGRFTARSEEHTSELQSLMRISYAVFCLKKNTKNTH